MTAITPVTLNEYDRMILRGDFEPRESHHVELVRGEILAMNPIGPSHEYLVDLMTRWSFRSVPDDVLVRVQNSIGIPLLDSAPQPDLAWVRAQDYSRGRPTSEDVLLVIEVADSSLRFDTGAKADLYAEAGISDYWVVRVPDKVVEVRRDPTEGRYRSVQRFSGSDEIRPLALPNIALRPAFLWSR